MTTKTDGEQERADFEAWYVDHFTRQTRIGGFTTDDLYTMRGPHGDYRDYSYVHGAWSGYQAGRAALQSQDRGYAVERLIEAVRNYMSFGCPVCSGDCFSANPPVSGCPAREAQEAIDHARRIEGE